MAKKQTLLSIGMDKKGDESVFKTTYVTTVKSVSDGQISGISLSGKAVKVQLKNFDAVSMIENHVKKTIRAKIRSYCKSHNIPYVALGSPDGRSE